jgi:hypothetical protein
LEKRGPWISPEEDLEKQAVDVACMLGSGGVTRNVNGQHSSKNVLILETFPVEHWGTMEF